MKEISIELNIKYSTIQYYYNPRYREKAIERSKKRLKRLGDTRNKEKRRQYQKDYQSRRYKEDKEFREKQKERSINYQKKIHNLGIRKNKLINN